MQGKWGNAPFCLLLLSVLIPGKSGYKTCTFVMVPAIAVVKQEPTTEILLSNQRKWEKQSL